MQTVEVKKKIARKESEFFENKKIKEDELEQRTLVLINQKHFHAGTKIRTRMAKGAAGYLLCRTGCFSWSSSRTRGSPREWQWRDRTVEPRTRHL